MVAVVVGTRLTDRARLLRDAVDQAADSLIFEPDSRRLRATLEAGRVHCVIAASAGDVHDVVRVLRGSDIGAGIPIIALASPLSERLVLGLFALGADDVLPEEDFVGLARRIATLSKLDMTPEVIPPQGTCLIAHEDAGRRAVLGGVLRQAGFDVKLAATMYEAQSVVAMASPPKAVLMSANLPPDGGTAALDHLAKRISGRMPAVLLASSSYAGALSPGGHFVVPEHAPPNDLLFVLHELLRARAQTEARVSRRVLSATLCIFCPAGELVERSFALTYNVSREGIYLRTLGAPPVGARVWLTLRPPGASSAVRVGGTVMWSRMRLASGWSAAPPGFAMQLSPELCPQADLMSYTEHYDRMLRLMSLT